MTSTIHNVLQAMDNIANAPASLTLRLIQPAPPRRLSQSTADLTPPKVVKRKRRLTLPLDSPATNVSGKARWFGKPEQQHVFDQQQSPLMRLPAELRAEIWGQVILGKEDGNIALRWRSEGSGRGRASAFKVIVGGNENEENLGVLGMLRSCRMIYSEAINLLYSLPVFSFRNQNVETFLAFVGSIPQHRKDHVRFLDLTWLSYLVSYTESRLPQYKRRREWSYRRITNIKALSGLPDATTMWTKNGFVDSDWIVDEILKSMKGLRKGGVKRGRASTGCFAQ